MFTGIVEELGHVIALKRSSFSCVLQIGAHIVLEDAKVGDSIAVNGVCLTVTTLDNDSFTADCMPETMRRSSLGSLKPGDGVNLERAMPANGRFGGHIVSGHIDGTGNISKITKDANAVWYRIGAPNSILRYIIEKGSVAIDGISLTVARVHEGSFDVSVIPHTRAVTNLTSKNVGDVVNLENDIVGKYVETLLRKPAETPRKEEKVSGLSLETLIENGF